MAANHTGVVVRGELLGFAASIAPGNTGCGSFEEEQRRMDSAIERALVADKVIDITTVGRKSAEKKRIEIWFHRVNGEVFITGLPGKRSWYANLVAHPEFTFHLKESSQADLRARALPITEPAERRAVFEVALPRIGRESELTEWIASSPLVRVEFIS